MSVSDDEVEAAARAMCVAKGIDPDCCRDVSFPSATARAPREGAPAPTIQVLGKGPAAWEMEAPFARAALSAASKVRAIREGDGEWVMMPREPTPEMIAAGSEARPYIEEGERDEHTDLNTEGTYAAMVAARPERQA